MANFKLKLFCLLFFMSIVLASSRPLPDQPAVSMEKALEATRSVATEEELKSVQVLSRRQIPPSGPSSKGHAAPNFRRHLLQFMRKFWILLSFLNISFFQFRGGKKYIFCMLRWRKLGVVHYSSDNRGMCFSIAQAIWELINLIAMCYRIFCKYVDQSFKVTCEYFSMWSRELVSIDSVMSMIVVLIVNHA